MLTGKELGLAIKSAIELKRVSKSHLAKDFDVKPPAVDDWIKRGTISKDKLQKLWVYFSDVVGPEHWGFASYPWDVSTHEQALDVLTAVLKKQSLSMRRELLDTLSVLILAPDSPEAKARVLTALKSSESASLPI
jgi:hypothetical protein